jgi:hypothetical protein
LPLYRVFNFFMRSWSYALVEKRSTSSLNPRRYGKALVQALAKALAKAFAIGHVLTGCPADQIIASKKAGAKLEAFKVVGGLNVVLTGLCESTKEHREEPERRPGRQGRVQELGDPPGCSRVSWFSWSSWPSFGLFPGLSWDFH